MEAEGDRVIPVRGGEGDYPVVIGRGLLDRIGEEVSRRIRPSHAAVISDARVAALHGGRVTERLRSAGIASTLFPFPEGERHKNRECWSDLTDRMLGAGLDREALVVAVGGGVTGDLGGFVAATYLRGIPVIQVPTSLVAMIDASVGGKTGVDTPAGKNLVGAFHPPLAVLADPEAVTTLDPRERVQGIAEAIKHGAILDRGHVTAIEQGREGILQADPEVLRELVGASVALKARVVSLDEREGGLRRILNFGHTLGHAFEAESAFELPHGSAVAIGMVAEARLGEDLGVTEPGTALQLATLLEGFGLPTRPPGSVDPDAILRWARSDKKNAGGRVRVVLLRRIGETDPGEGWVHAVPEESIRRLLEQGW